MMLIKRLGLRLVEHQLNIYKPSIWDYANEVLPYMFRVYVYDIIPPLTDMTWGGGGVIQVYTAGLLRTVSNMSMGLIHKHYN